MYFFSQKLIYVGVWSQFMTPGIPAGSQIVSSYWNLLYPAFAKSRKPLALSQWQFKDQMFFDVTAFLDNKMLASPRESWIRHTQKHTHRPICTKTNKLDCDTFLFPFPFVFYLPQLSIFFFKRENKIETSVVRLSREWQSVFVLRCLQPRCYVHT